MTVLETARLQLRHLTTDDADFMLRLLNEPSFLRYIGDRGVRTTEDARNYILTGPIASYQRFGFGLYLVVLAASHTPIGICGLLKRDTLEDADIGFAFVPEHWGAGYALEAAGAVKSYGRDVIGLSRILAITNPDNAASIRLLAKIGFTFARMVRLAPNDTELKLFACQL